MKIVLYGSGTAVCDAAIRCAQSGHSVLLVTKDCFLGGENGDKQEWFQRMRQNHVTVLFHCAAAGIVMGNGAACGLLLANKLGLQLLQADLLIDGSDDGVLCQMLGGVPQKSPAYFTMQFEKAGTVKMQCNGTMYETAAQLFLEHRRREPQEKLIRMSYRRRPEKIAPCTVQVQNIVRLAEKMEIPPTVPCDAEHIVNRTVKIPLSACRVTAFEEEVPELRRVTFDFKRYLPVRRHHEIVVAGAGTGGVAAAVAARRRGRDVLVVEFHPGIGGTQTFGRVSGYYMGFREGYAMRQTEELLQQGFEKSPEGRLLYYEKLFRELDIPVWRDTVICGGIADESIVTAGTDGLGLVTADVMVDATGDSDVAAFWGAGFEVGAPEDGTMQDCSQWQVQALGTDLDVFNHLRYAEMLRATSMAHQQPKDFGEMLAARESRRIACDYAITMADVLKGADYPDTIAVARTDCDPHGPMSSPFALMGFTPYHGEVYEAAIPYRACIPQGFQRLLLASKSVGAEQDAAAYLRMAADVQNRGYAVGTAAAMAAELRCGVREVPVKCLRALLKKENLLPEQRHKVRMEPLLSLLLGETKQGSAEDTVVARAWYGKPDARICGWLEQWMAVEEPYDDWHPKKPGNHRGGVIGGICSYWKINRLLTVIGRSKDRSCIEAVCKLIERTEAGGPPVNCCTTYVAGRMDLQKIPQYDRVRCICYCVAQIPDRRFIAPLEALLRKPYIGGYVSKTCETSGVQYQSAYLELQIAGALMKCGSETGRQRVQEYTEDVHAVLRDYAKKLLKQEKQGKT